MAVNFPAVEAWDFDREQVSFPAQLDGTSIRCAISWEALQDNFEGNGVDPLDCFRAHRPAIEHKAERLIGARRFEADGSILIRSQDGS
jgi:hypothetical protein